MKRGSAMLAVTMIVFGPSNCFLTRGYCDRIHRFIAELRADPSLWAAFQVRFLRKKYAKYYRSNSSCLLHCSAKSKKFNTNIVWYDAAFADSCSTC
ncbi:hypothetical protein PR001_g14594 [Phytophthora rubi]|uniref:Secreted protein n=1 Tax=Phytophthora rubi TaxID=129364 RepID=A0A6A3LDF1_9STRA|nr:hypothetical protein PF003_g21727 [Phytophthora fragariae]KAE9016650.1 hypothetical protein PR001_g14594 [Phytophthora rubi]